MNHSATIAHDTDHRPVLENAVGTHIVLGARGYLGEQICQRLHHRGEDVLGVDVLPFDSAVPWAQQVADVRTVRPESWPSHIRHVHHCASVVPLHACRSDFWDINVNSVNSVVQALQGKRLDGVIYYSSSAVFGLNDRGFPHRIDEVPRPMEFYGASKLAAEKKLTLECGMRSIPLLIVRPRTIVGKGRLGLFELLFHWISQNQNIFIIGAGSQPLQMVHVDDLLDGVEVLLRKGYWGISHIGGPVGGGLLLDLQELTRKAQRYSQVLSVPECIIHPLNWLESCGLNPFSPWQYLSFSKPHILDCAPLLDLGWEPRYDNASMLWQSYQHFLDRSNRGSSLHRRGMDLGLFGFLRR